MQNTKIYTVVGFSVVLLAAGISYLVGPQQVGQPRSLAVDTFPVQIGDWKAGAQQPVDPDVQKRLATARIMERVYTNQVTGQVVDLMLLTATDSEDIHNPRVCFPSQGWQLGQSRPVKLQGLTMSEFHAAQDQDQRTVLYWMTGHYPAQRYGNALLNKAVAFRSKVVDHGKNNSLFVRIMVRSSSQNDQALDQFTTSVIPPLQALMETGLTANERGTVPAQKLWQDVS